MKSIIYKQHTLRGRLLCSVFGHRFRMTRLVTNHFKEFECTCCHMQVTNDAHGHKVSLTEEHREINRALLELYHKRVSHA